MSGTEHRCWWVIIGLGDGLVPPVTSHYLNQCWPIFIVLLYVAPPQWVKWFNLLWGLNWQVRIFKDNNLKPNTRHYYSEMSWTHRVSNHRKLDGVLKDQANGKEISKVYIIRPFQKGDQWLSSKKGQCCEKCLHAMTSIWEVNSDSIFLRDVTMYIYAYICIHQSRFTSID